MGVGEVLRNYWLDMVIYGVQLEQCDLFDDRYVLYEIQGFFIGIVLEVCNFGIVIGMVGVLKFVCLLMIWEVL